MESVLTFCGTVMDPLLEPIAHIASNPTVQTVTLGFSGAVVGILTAVLATGNNSDDIRNMDLLQELITLEKLNTTQSEIALKYKSVIQMLGLLVSCFVFGILSLFFMAAYLLFKVRTIEKLKISTWLMDHEHRLSNVQFTSERLLDKEDEIFYSQSDRLHAECNIIKNSIDEMTSDKMNLFDEMTVKFYTKIVKNKNTIKSDIIRFENEKSSIERLIKNSEIKLQKINEKRDKLDISVSKFKEEFDTKYSNLEQSTDNLQTLVSKQIKELNSVSANLSKDYDLNKIQVCKSNVMLIDAQILFDAALTRFELIEGSMNQLLKSELDDSINDEDNNAGKDEGSNLDRLENCLKLALKTRKKIELIQKDQSRQEEDISSLTQILNDIDNSSTSSRIENDDRLTFEHFKIYSESTDYMIAELNEKMNTLESRLKKQGKKIKSNDSSIQETKSFAINEMKSLKVNNQQWIYKWISALYGLFNADVTQLQLQLQGLNELKSLKSLEETGNYLQDECSFISDFIHSCKRQCVTLLREISLLMFEFYLMKSGKLSKKQIVDECEGRIQKAVTNIFNEFRHSVEESDLKVSDSENLSKVILHFEDKLTSDLNLTCSNINMIYSQSLDDFYIIFKTLNELDSAWNNSSSDDENSIILIDSKTMSSSSSDEENDSDILVDHSPNSSSSSSSWGISSDLIGTDTHNSIYKPLRLVEKRKSC